MAQEATAQSMAQSVLEPSRPRRASRFSEQYGELLSAYKGTPLDVNFRALVGPLPARDLTHNLFPYPARLVRHIPMFLMGASEFVSAGSTIFDPFCGSGTVLVEAQAWSHESIGVDSNPVAVLAARVKTCPVDESLLNEVIQRVRRRASSLRAGRVPATFLLKWYSSQASSVLGRLARALADEPSSP
ncbi:MAG: hypothetical protein IT190_04165, partial [Microbacteriaceae bacterium]|nr:hypothetical protein [Microbacteriaceae bacterium]